MAVIVLPFSSCTYNRLTNVEKTMEANVQSADSMLNTIEPPASGRSLALYSLLRTQIDYKLYRDIPTDSVIRIATDYYGFGRKDYHAAMAWYSLGCISGLLGNEITAANSYNKAIHLFPDTLIRYFALAEQNLGAIYLYNNLNEEAIHILRSCRINSERLSDSITMAFCDYHLALDLLFHKQYGEAKEKFSELKENVWLLPDTEDGVMLQLAKISLYGDKNFIGTIRYIDSLFVHGSLQSSFGQMYSIKADAFYNLGLVDSAQHYYQISIQHTEDPYTLFDCYRKLTEISSNSNDTESRLFYTSKADECLDSITEISKSNILFNSLLEHTEHENANGSSVYLITLVVLILIIGTAIKILRSPKSSGRNIQIPDNVQSLLDLKYEIEEVKNSEIYKEILSVVSTRETLSSKRRNELIEKSHGYLINTRSFLMSEYSLNYNEIDFCFFILLGINPSKCKIFFNYSDSGIRTLKYRIKKKLPASEFNNLFSEKDY